MPKPFSLKSISTTAAPPPPRMFLYAPEGWGKTTFGALAPKPLVLQCRGETGLEELVAASRLPDGIPHYQFDQWSELREAVSVLTKESIDFESIVIDTVNSAEALCQEDICQKEYDGEWGEKGFAAYGRGYDVTRKEWASFLDDLDKLRRGQQVRLICLAHTQTKTFQNPEGTDYDRHSPAMDKRVWADMHRWADMILYGAFDDGVKMATDGRGQVDPNKKGKAKASSGNKRVLYTTRSALFDAKNRHGLPPKIILPSDHLAGWNTLMNEIEKAKAENAAILRGEKPATKPGAGILG